MVTGVSAHARAVRARRGARGPTSCSSTTGCSGTARRGRSRAAGAQAAAAARPRHGPRRLPPPAGRPPRARQQRPDRRALGARGVRAVRRHAASRSAWPRVLPATGSRATSWSRACARPPAGASRSSSSTGPSRVRTIGIVSGAAADHVRRRHRRRARRLPDRRARRAGHGASPARTAIHVPRGRPPRHGDVRRPRGSATLARPSASGVATMFLDVPEPV